MLCCFVVALVSIRVDVDEATETSTASRVSADVAVEASAAARTPLYACHPVAILISGIGCCVGVVCW